jgi:hypothetical protein
MKPDMSKYDRDKYNMQLEAELDRKFMISANTNTNTNTNTITTAATGVLSARAFSTPQKEMEVLVRPVENGYTARIDGRVYIATSIEELTGLITVRLLALGSS